MRCNNSCFSYSGGTGVYYKTELSGYLKVVFGKDGKAVVHTSSFTKIGNNVQEVKVKIDLYSRDGADYPKEGINYIEYQYKALGLGKEVKKIDMKIILEKFAGGKQCRLFFYRVIDEDPEAKPFWDASRNQYTENYLKKVNDWIDGGYQKDKELELIALVAKPRN